MPVVVIAAALIAGTAVAVLAHRGGRGSAAAQPGSPTEPPVTTVPTQAGESVGESLPGAPPFPPDLVARPRARWAAREASYRPRTRHLRADGSPEYINRLFLESSPYLMASQTLEKMDAESTVIMGYSGKLGHPFHVIDEHT